MIHQEAATNFHGKRVILDALSAYAYGHREQAHPGAIAADRAKPFHHQSAFIRFRPYQSEGHLDGKNPLAETWLCAT